MTLLVALLAVAALAAMIAWSLRQPREQDETPAMSELSSHQVETLGMIFWKSEPEHRKELRETFTDIANLPETAWDEEALA